MFVLCKNARLFWTLGSPTYAHLFAQNGMGKVKLKLLLKEHISFLHRIILPLSSPPKISASR